MLTRKNVGHRSLCQSPNVCNMDLTYSHPIVFTSLSGEFLIFARGHLTLHFARVMAQ